MITTEIINNQDFQLFKIPKSLKIDDTKVYLKKVGNGIFIIPFHNPWQSFFDSLTEFSDDFMDTREQPNQNRVIFD